MFIPPMLASKIKDDFHFMPHTWAVEEKYDGIRLVAEVTQGVTTPWSRDGIIHLLPPQILFTLTTFPDCTLDGEIFVPGKRCYGTLTHANASEMIYCIFDVMVMHGVNLSNGHNYDQRRQILIDINRWHISPSVQLAWSSNVETWEEVEDYRDRVWSRDGEGLILKRRQSTYEVDRRSKNWLKIKKLESAVLTIIGFEHSRGTKVNRGPYAMVRLRGDDGVTTTVKTKNDAECRKFEAEAEAIRQDGLPDGMQPPHPALGRKLAIEYQERTKPDNAYREPRWKEWVT